MYTIFKNGYCNISFINNFFDFCEKYKKDNLKDFIKMNKLKTIVIGFEKKSKLLDNNFSFNNKMKQILNNFSNKITSCPKVIVSKNKYYYKYNTNNNRLIIDNNINDLFLSLSNESRNDLIMYSKIIFEYFIANRNDSENYDILHYLKLYYKRLRLYDVDDYMTAYYHQYNLLLKNNLSLKIKRYFFKEKTSVFSKMIFLINKLVFLNSNFFFLNNVKYNYTLLKFCDKTMKMINSILLFCLLININIPHYCFHSDLSIAGNCRMCLVQMDTSIKPVASCAVGIGINSNIFTNTRIIQKAREGVLEFLLVNHPLDCPVCDQGGECDLQEQSISYGNDRGSFLRSMI